MTDEQKTVLTMPLAVIVAGALIAFAIYASNKPTTPETDSSANSNQQAAAPAAGQPPQPTVGDFRPVDNSDHVRGATDAKVTVLEYSDLECPFCKQFHATLQQISKEYPDDVNWVYRHAPLVQLHQQAPAEANAAECAAEQEKFWEFVDTVFATTQGNDTLDLETLPDLARKAGVADISQFESCVKNGKYTDKVQDQLIDAQTAGLRGTPYSLIIGPDNQVTPIHGAQQYSQVKAAIDAMLN